MKFYRKIIGRGVPVYIRIFSSHIKGIESYWKQLHQLIWRLNLGINGPQGDCDIWIFEWDFFYFFPARESPHRDLNEESTWSVVTVIICVCVFIDNVRTSDLWVSTRWCLFSSWRAIVVTVHINFWHVTKLFEIFDLYPIAYGDTVDQNIDPKKTKPDNSISIHMIFFSLFFLWRIKAVTKL